MNSNKIKKVIRAATVMERSIKISSPQATPHSTLDVGCSMFDVRCSMFNLVLFFAAILTSITYAQQSNQAESMKDSLVYLKISYYGYEQYQPWRNTNLTEGWGVGVVVAQNKIITPAYNIANAAEIQAKRFGQNEFIAAKIKIISYENNLALIELDANSIKKPLVPVKFTGIYAKGAPVEFYWLSPTENIYSGRGYLDRASVDSYAMAFSKVINFVAASASDRTHSGQLYCIGKKPIGIAGWSNENKEAGIIPAEVINRFLNDSKDGDYNGTGAVGFSAAALLDSALRKYLKMPADMQLGVYVADVFTLGTAADILKAGDVILSIDGCQLNPYGRFTHKQYDALYYDYLITSKTAGEKITFDIFRDGKKQTLQTTVKNFNVSDMLVPWYDLDAQPEYYVIGGCVLQKLTKTYMAARGENWASKAEPHIYNYLLNSAFKPTEDRKSIVVLSFILPGDITLGYHGLSQLVVDKINGMKISSMRDLPAAFALNPQDKYDVLEFELDEPKIVLDRSKLPQADATIAQTYGIDKPANIK
ncbi:MAG: PDZ domain-containing protein [Sedimentisphaerales bacterium]